MAVRDGLIAVAVDAPIKTDLARAVFFDAEGVSLASVTVGALPGMLT